MLPGPNILHQCTNCGKQFYSESFGSGNTFDATFWSDGYVDAPMYPDYPPFVRCPHCKTGLWLDKLEELAELPLGIIPDVPKCFVPDVKSILKQLSKTDHSYNQEIWLLQRLIQITNHRRRKIRRPLSRTGKFALEAFIQLVPDYYSDETYLDLIECHRELGDFEKAEEMCKNYNFTESDYGNEISQQLEWILSQNPYPMIYKEF